MLKNFLGLINNNSRLINDDEASDQIQEFARQVFEAFRISQIGEKTDEEKKVSFFTNFDKILKSTGLKSNEKLKDEIYDDLISNAESHLSRIEIGKRAKDALGFKESGVRVRTARNFQNNETDNEIDSIQIRLLIYNLRHRSEQQIEGSPSSFRLGWSELLPILTPEIIAYLRSVTQIHLLGRRDIRTQNPFFQLFSAGELPLRINKQALQPPLKSSEEIRLRVELEPPAQPIAVMDIKHDKVAEFKKFLEDNNLNCTNDNIQKIFALHELYEAYEAFGEINDRKDATEISSNTKKRLRDQIEKILLPNATEQSVQQENDITKKEMPDYMLGEVPKSSIEIEKEGKDSEIEPHGKPNDAKIDAILKYLSEHNKQKKQDNEATDQLNSAQKSNLDDLRKKNVLQFLNFKFPLFTNSRNEKIIDFYEKYASEPEEDKKLKFKVEFIMAIADGINVQNNINALDTLKTLDALNKNNIDDIKKAGGKAKQEEPNEIIKFFFEDLPNTILSVFDCIRTDSRTGKGPQQ